MIDAVFAHAVVEQVEQQIPAEALPHLSNFSASLELGRQERDRILEDDQVRLL